MSSRLPLRHAGFSLPELLLALVLGALLLAAVAGAAQQAGLALQGGAERDELDYDAAYALQRMTSTLQGGGRLLLPFPDNPNTPARDESVRDFLVVTMGPLADRNGNGHADADIDFDDKVDEDPSADFTADGVSGIPGLDWNGDGTPNNGAGAADDDEDGAVDEDPLDGVDNDGDGAVDEDTPARQTGGTGSANDDGDGSVNEDWMEVVAYYVRNGELIERLPDLGGGDGNAWTERVIARRVTSLQLRLLPAATGERSARLRITLTLAGASGRQVNADATLRAGNRQ